MTEPPVELDIEPRDGLMFFWGLPQLTHCNHFNRSHQMFLEDPHYFDTETVFLQSAAECSYTQTMNYLETLDNPTFEDAVEFGEFVFQLNGFGQINLSQVDGDGGVINQPSSHYGEVLQLNPGTREEPGEYFDRGFAAGVILAGSEVSDMPYDEDGLVISQTDSIVLGDDENRFDVEVGGDFQWLKMLDPVDDYQWDVPVPDHDLSMFTVDYDSILERAQDFEMNSDESGLIQQFGLTLTRGYLDFYAKTLGRFLNEIEAQFGNPAIARDIIQEIGHYCGFFMTGRMMQSPEFKVLAGGEDELNQPQDYFWTMLTLMEIMGWGHYRCEELIPNEKLVVSGYNWFDGTSYLTWFGETDQNVEWLTEGGAGSFMNLLYYADDVEEVDITKETYKDMFNKRTYGYSASNDLAMTTGDDYTRTVVSLDEN